MRFKFDENLPADAARILREAGNDVVTVLEQGMKGTSDDSLTSVRTNEGRVLVTLDVDFANITAYPPRDHAGIVVLRLPRQDKFTILNVMRTLSVFVESQTVDRKLWIVEGERIRVRE